ncbi:hypothetical protein [Bacillus wiedmannii]
MFNLDYIFFKTLRRWILRRLNLCEVTNALAHVIFWEIQVF